jgi:hypothetical protein
MRRVSWGIGERMKDEGPGQEAKIRVGAWEGEDIADFGMPGQRFSAADG